MTELEHGSGAVEPAGHGGTLRPTGPLEDPGIPPHRPRPTDVDPRAAKRAERQVAGMFVLSSLLTIGFVVAYFAIPNNTRFLDTNASNLALGGTLGLALLLIGLAAIQWAKKLMVDEEVSEERHLVASTPEERREAIDLLLTGAAESGLGRRTLIKLSLLPAMGLLVAPVVVLLRDLGPLPGNDLRTTSWKKGMRLVRDGLGTPIKASDIVIGSLVNVEPGSLYPEGPETPTAGSVAGEDDVGTDDVSTAQIVRARSAAIVIRMAPGEATVPVGREDWNVDGIFCYSKICVHMGCPISLYEQQTHILLCPCHQSQYDLSQAGKVVFGPATRPMPQLPIKVDSSGYLIARDGFNEPVGPSFWNRG
jgi:ubiquinol-cytochrome c reductase iron-sulfur subunit